MNRRLKSMSAVSSIGREHSSFKLAKRSENDASDAETSGDDFDLVIFAFLCDTAPLFCRLYSLWVERLQSGIEHWGTPHHVASTLDSDNDRVELVEGDAAVFSLDVVC